MKISKKQEHGFSLIEILLAVLLLGLIATVSFLFYAHQTKNPASMSNQNTNPYDGWYSYKSPAEGFTFRYPVGWLVTNDPSQAQGGVKEYVKLTTSDFTMTYTLTKIDPTLTIAEAKNEATAQGEPDPATLNMYHDIASFIPKNYDQRLYLVATSNNFGETGGPTNAISLTAYHDYSTQPYAYSNGYYLAKNNSGYIVQWYGSFGNTGMPLATFLSNREVKTADLILESIAY